MQRPSSNQTRSARRGAAAGSGNLRPALALFVLVLGCAPAPSPHAEPSALDFTPAAPQRTLFLVNPEDRPAPLTRVRLDTRTPDWGSFVITDPSLPNAIPPRGEVEIHMSANPAHFRVPAGGPHPAEPLHRGGQSRLLFEIDGTPQSVALRFGPTPALAPLALAAKLAVLAAVLAALVARARRARTALVLPLPLLIAAALIPFGDALCPAALAAPLPARQLARCAEGFDAGTPLQVVVLDGGLLLLIAGLLLPALFHLAAAPRAPSPTAALRQAARELGALLLLALAAAAAALSLGAAEPRALVLAQRAPLAATLPSWGLFLQPLGAAAFLLAAALRRPSAAPVLEDLALAALFVVIFLGGWDLPLLPFERLPHLAAIALQVALTLAKIAALHHLLGRLRLALRGSPLQGAAGLRLALLLALGGLALALAPLLG